MLTINNIRIFFLLLIFSKQYLVQATETISRQKCREYGEHINFCYISDDEEVHYGQFPHIASIGYKSGDGIKFKCSGVLISDQYILTTSFCRFDKWSGYAAIVKLGALYYEDSINETNTQEVKIKEIIGHPNYKPPGKYNDISLLKLEHPVKINKYVRPACLPDVNEKEEKFILTGWETFNTSESNPSLTTRYNIFEVSNQKCNNLFQKSRSLKNGIDVHSHFCAEPPEIVCKMIGGSPLQTLDKNVNCIYNIHAISSFGTPCPSPVPTVFTKISAFIPWIESIVWP